MCIYYFNILSRMNETSINIFFVFSFIFYINLIQLRYFRTDLQVFNLEKPLFHCFAICIFLSILLYFSSFTPSAIRDLFLLLLQYVGVSDSFFFLPSILGLFPINR